MQKKIALLHRFPAGQIKETNAAFPYLEKMGIDVLTFKSFNRLSPWKKFLKSILWVFYSPMLVAGKGYDVIYCDDSFPFYPALVKLASPRSRVIIRLGDLHLMYYTSGLVYKFFHFFERIGWLLADDIISISDQMAAYLMKETLRVPHVALDPVDPKDFPIGDNRNNGTVMFHGLLTKNKNVDILLDAARLMPDLDFVIIGDGPDYKRLKDLAPRNVFFLGWVPFKSVHNYIANCTIGVALRSNNPANEYVVTSPFLQYGIMGKPCLVTRRKVFQDYPWQFSAVQELVGKIRYLITFPEEKEGEKLRECILKNHDAEKIGAQIWSVLQS